MASESKPPGFYGALADSLSQGDIVKNVPWGVIEAPLTFCRPDSKPGRAFYAEIAQAQRDPKPFTRGPEVIHALGNMPCLGMVIWEDCQIDKMKNQGREERKWYVAVAPLIPLSDLPNEKDRTTIREGRRMAFFPVPATRDVPESYVDLRLMWPVRQSLLTERLAALSAEGRAALYGHIFTFLTAKRFILPSLCPKCGAELEAATILQDARD